MSNLILININITVNIRRENKRREAVINQGIQIPGPTPYPPHWEETQEKPGIEERLTQVSNRKMKRKEWKRKEKKREQKKRK
jgi:hypothetical protein